MSENSTLIACNGKITRAELANVPTPSATTTHIPISHLAVVQGLVETLGHRQIGVVGEEFAVSKDGMEMFGVIDLESSFDGCRFAIGIRNANNKRFPRLARSACGCSCVTTSHFRGIIAPFSRNIRRTFRWRTACRLALTRCNATSSRCGGRWKDGEHNNCPRRRRN